MYNTDDEQKKYEIIGKVEIGTDEYRDLIEQNVKLKKENSEQWSAKYEVENKLNRANKIIENQKARIESFQSFLKDEKLEDKFQLYLLQRLQQKDAESEEE